MPEVVSNAKTPVHQSDATYNAAPASGVKYEVLNDTNLRILAIAAKVSWTVQPDPLEVHITVDGVEYTFAKSNPASATFYAVIGFRAHVAPTDQALDSAAAQVLNLEGRSIKVEAEITGGTVSNLTCRVIYQKW